MVRIRLRRVGTRRKLRWRIVVTDERSPRDGRFIETIGNYDASTDPPGMVIEEERLRHWVGRGAQISDTVRVLVRKKGIKL